MVVDKRQTGDIAQLRARLVIDLVSPDFDWTRPLVKTSFTGMMLSNNCDPAATCPSYR